MTSGPATVAETHISWVFFVGDRAYKLKKPVRYGFVDFTSREARQLACRREVELNRRLAPDVYLGVLDVVDRGRVRDHLVEMRRMPPERRLSTLVSAGDVVAAEAVALAELLAGFHLRAPLATAPDMGDLWERSFVGVEPFVGGLLSSEEEARVETLARRYLAGRSSLFLTRQIDGFVRDGHGDLLADDIFLLDDGPRVLDCIEFDDQLRYFDVLGDIAFLAMDLERLGAASLAAALVERWASIVDPDFPPSLLHHYVAYRAHIRCKVACLRHEQGDAGASELARTHLSLARRHLEQAAVKLVLVGGMPGTGKSTLSQQLGPALDAEIIRSDEVRRELNIPEAERYSDTAKSRVYAEIVERVGRHLSVGRSVVADATWASAKYRRLARQAALRTSSDIVELRCEVDAATAAERIRLRSESYGSEAIPAHAETLSASDAWPEAIVISTANTTEAALTAARLATGAAE